MATTTKAKVKTAPTTKKTAATKKKTTKKTATIEQIEKLEKALGQTKEEEVINLVPEEVKAEIEAGEEEKDALENPQPIDIEEEMKRIVETAEPSEEVKEQVVEFEEGKQKFNEKLEKEPENAEKIVRQEIKRIEEIKKRAEAIRASLQEENKKNIKNDIFTNWWNGMSNGF